MERFNWKHFFYHFIFYIFLFCFRRLSKKIESLVNTLWHVCQTWLLRVQMNVFNRNFSFWEETETFFCLFINLWFSGKKLWILEKILVEVEKIHSTCPGLRFQRKNNFIRSSLLFPAFPDHERKKSSTCGARFSASLVECTQRIQINTFWKTVFIGKSFIFQSILYIETKFVRNFSKNLYTEKISILILTGRIER